MKRYVYLKNCDVRDWVDWLENKFLELMLSEDDAPKEASGEIHTSIEEQIEKLETLKNLEEDGKR